MGCILATRSHNMSFLRKQEYSISSNFWIISFLDSHFRENDGYLDSIRERKAT